MKPSVGTNVRITASASQGGRRYMEDRMHIEVFRKPDGSIDWVYCAVYDGHGGPEASEFVRRHLLTNIRNSSNFDTDDDEKFLEAIRQGFVQTHYSMLKVVDSWPKTSSGYSCTAGTTASCVFIRNGKLYTGHVGDSAIFLGRKMRDFDEFGARLEAIRLTVDHKPDSVAERHRIESAGGAVMNKAGINRVVWSRPKRGHSGPITADTPVESIPFLAVARALGDLWSYSHATGEYVVSPDPDVAVIELEENIKCLVLGSDGLTNVMNAQQMMDTVNTHEWKDLVKTYGTKAEDHVLDRPVHNNHAQWLLRQAMRQWGGLRADNISVIVLLFDSEQSDLVDDHTCVTHSGDLCLDGELTTQPDAMVRCDNRTSQRLRTTPVDLAYYGVVDKNYKITDYKGPGFVIHRNVREGSEERNGTAKPLNGNLRNVMSSASSCHSEPATRSSNNSAPATTARLPSILAALQRSKEAAKEKLEQKVSNGDIVGDIACAEPSQPFESDSSPGDMSIVEDELLPAEEVEPSPSETEPAHPEPTSTADPIQRPKSRMERRPGDVESGYLLNEAEFEAGCKTYSKEKDHKQEDTTKENGNTENDLKKEKLKFFCKKHGGSCEKAIKLNEQHKRDRENKKKLEVKSMNSMEMQSRVECISPSGQPVKSFEDGDRAREQKQRSSSIGDSQLLFMQSLPLLPRLGSASALSPSAMLTAMRAASASHSKLPPATITPFRSLSLESPLLTSPSAVQVKAAAETPVNRSGDGPTRRFKLPLPDAAKKTVTPAATPGLKRPRLTKAESDAHIEPHHKRSRVLEFFHSVTGLLGVGSGDKRDKSAK